MDQPIAQNKYFKHAVVSTYFDILHAHIQGVDICTITDMKWKMHAHWGDFIAKKKKYIS